jgi:hypothetical protein
MGQLLKKKTILATIGGYRGDSPSFEFRKCASTSIRRTMPTFMLELSRALSDSSWSLSCSISGEHKGFNSLRRCLGTESEVVEALKEAGISSQRFELAIDRVRNDSEAAFEVSQNEAQKLSILHTDTSE